MTMASIQMDAVQNQDILKLAEGKHHDPFSILGWMRDESNKRVIGYRAFRPDAEQLYLRLSADSKWLALEQKSVTGCFEIDFTEQAEFKAMPLLQSVGAELKVVTKSKHEFCVYDPYGFPVDAQHESINSFSEGESFTSYEFLGCHQRTHHGISGVEFTVWAPGAERVSVVGDFCQWDGRIYPMCNLGASGIWTLFLPGVATGAIYKYEIRNRDSGDVFTKSDPYARLAELPPSTASMVASPAQFHWQDDLWMKKRERWRWLENPVSIYEVHLGSWRQPEGEYPSYRELAEPLVSYVKELGFTHIQLMPITEHPFDGSWGYQVTGFFAATCRYGSPDDLRYLIDYCHNHDIGVLLDWVPGHFPKDAHGLARFDGTALYEHEHPLMGEHQDWGTLIFNYGRQEVRNFLLSSAYFWIKEFHIDGLRVDAVASMLYLDYSRDEWLPNKYGSNENLDAISFLRTLNERIHQDFPGALMIAEESTAWPQVSRPIYLGGLGFSMKWNMGWMNDTLSYIEKDPIHRKYHHDKLTFSLLYAFSENFILPFSHDEVVHGKGSILNKMPGDAWQKFANVRLLYTYQFTHPGKKLLFMGSEFAQGDEWDHNQFLHWELTQYPLQQGIQQTIKDLNQLYKSEPALHRFDFEEGGFEWLDCNDSDQSVVSFLRKCEDGYLIVVLNFTPQVLKAYRVGVPEEGTYGEVFNSDSIYYQGSNISNGTEIVSAAQPWGSCSHSIELTIPPLAGLVLKRLG